MEVRGNTPKHFSYFSNKKSLDFSCKLSPLETISSMECQDIKHNIGFVLHLTACKSVA